MSGKFCAGLAIVFGALYFFALGRSNLGNPDEGRYAEIPREMNAAHHWTTPRLDGVVYFEKPPLMYWVECVAQKVFGRSEFAVRTPVALIALLGVLMTFAAVSRRFGSEAGLASGVVLGTSSFYAAFSHILSLDLAVAILISGTLFAFFVGVYEPPGPARRRLFYTMYACAALATLTKGLIGVLLTGAVMLLWLIVCKEWKRLRPLYLPSGLLLFAVIAVPWHILIARHNPRWAQFYFVHEQWDRFFTTTHNRTGPLYYFVPEVIPGIFPWFGFLFAALAVGRPRRRPDVWFFVLWAGFIFLFFSQSQSKLPGYILPVFPALAALVGIWLADARRAPEADALRRTRAGLWCFAGFAWLLAIAVLVVVSDPLRFRLQSWQAEGLEPSAIGLALILVAGGLTAILAHRRRRLWGMIAAMALTGGLMVADLTFAMPYLIKPGTKGLAIEVSRLVQPGDMVFTYHEFFHDFPYYYGRTVGIVGFVGELEPENETSAVARSQFVSDGTFRALWDGPARAFAVARKKDVRALFADPTFQYHLLGETTDHYLFSNRP
ncbi:MAG TPA: glycosyltransferase family 39 protein [Opitutaceae bacterium]|jgi:4-amino-4-deoxy-L-arabinose transferase-like glycosyltransferase